MKKALIETTFAVLFTGTLCIFSMTAEPLSSEIRDTVENTRSVYFSSTDLKIPGSNNGSDALLLQPARSEEAQLEIIRFEKEPPGLILSEKVQTDFILSEEAQTDFILPEETQTDFILSEETQADFVLSEETQTDFIQLEEVRFDKDTLLSIVSSLPDDEEFFCSGPDILTSPQVKKVRSILQRFYKSDSNVGFIVLDLNTGNVFSLNSGFLFYSASTIKGPYVAALNKFSPEIVDEYTEFMMENTIQWSSNEDYENLHYLYGNDAMYDMTEYTDVSDSIIDEYNWYPYLTAAELTRLWIGTYMYFFEETNENSNWCQNLYTDSRESFIHSALSEDYTVYTKPGWYSDWEDVSRNDAGIVMADGHDYILTIMSDAFDSYDDLEELAAALDEVHELLCSSEIEFLASGSEDPGLQNRTELLIK